MNTDYFREHSRNFLCKIEDARKLISFHKPSIGYVGEELLRNFIRTIIPEGYKVCSGFIRQDYPICEFPLWKNLSDNKQSKRNIQPPQCDIIIYKDALGATEFKCGELATVNREFVHMIIEVKASIGHRGFEKTLRDFKLINIGRKVLFIYSGPTVKTIKKYFDNKSIDIENNILKANYLDDVVVNDCVTFENGVLIDREDDVAMKYDHGNFHYLPELIVSITPNKEYFLSKDYVILDGDYMGYNSFLFEDSKNKRISCLQELANYIEMSFGDEKYTLDRSKINDYYVIPLFRM